MHTSAKALHLTLDIIYVHFFFFFFGVLMRHCLILFPVPPLGTIAYAPS
jgi:hypothetical protein